MHIIWRVGYGNDGRLFWGYKYSMQEITAGAELRNPAASERNYKEGMCRATGLHWGIRSKHERSGLYGTNGVLFPSGISKKQYCLGRVNPRGKSSFFVAGGTKMW